MMTFMLLQPQIERWGTDQFRVKKISDPQRLTVVAGAGVPPRVSRDRLTDEGTFWTI